MRFLSYCNRCKYKIYNVTTIFQSTKQIQINNMTVLCFYGIFLTPWYILGRETLVLRKGEKGLSCPYQGGIMVIEVLIFKRKMFTFWKIKWISNKCKIFNDQIWSIVNPIKLGISFRSSIDNFILYIHVYSWEENCGKLHKILMAEVTF